MNIALMSHDNRKDLKVHCFLSYAHGGSQQIGARIAYNEFDLVLFFNDPSNEKMASEISYPVCSDKRLLDLLPNELRMVRDCAKYASKNFIMR